jgi:hypothetical protein
VRLAVLKAAPIGAGVVAFGLSGGTALAADPQAELQSHQQALQSQFAQGQAQLQSQKDALQSQLSTKQAQYQSQLEQTPSQLSTKQAQYQSQLEQTPSQLSAKQAQYESMFASQASGTNQGLNSMARSMNSKPKPKHHDYDSDSGQNANQSQQSDQHSDSKSEQNGSPTINVAALNSGKPDQSGSTQQQLSSQSAGGEKPHPWMNSVHPWGHNQIDP